MKNICFLLHAIDTRPCGGYKIVYEYANRLVARGWNVTIAYLYSSEGDLYPKYFIKRPLSALSFLWGYIWQRMCGSQGGKWFNLDRRIRKIYPLQFSNRVARRFHRGTKFVATYITTVMNLHSLDLPSEDKINFIQDFEAWEYSPEQVYETYRYPMVRIAISDWCAGKVAEAGSKAVVVPNGLDFRYFSMTNPIGARKRTEVAILYNKSSRKRTIDAIAALKIVKKHYPDLHVMAFGTSVPLEKMPEWIDFVLCPNKEMHNRIYNTAAIFVASSELEGWGLPPCEAMQCGAAVACTNAGGYLMFAKDGETALMSPVRNPQALADNICRLIADDELRTRIADAGHKNIQRFTWDRSVAMFETALNNGVDVY